MKDTCGVDRVLDGTIVILPLHAAAVAKLGQSTFRVKALSVMGGVSVEHQAISFYPHLSAGYIYGPAKIAGTGLTIVPPPAVLLSTSDGWNLTSGSKKTLKVTIQRFGEMKNKPLTIRAQRVLDGLLVDSVQVVPDRKEARLTATAGNITSSGTVILEALNAEGNAVGKSAAIPVEVRPEADTGSSMRIVSCLVVGLSVISGLCARTVDLGKFILPRFAFTSVPKVRRFFSSPLMMTE